MWVFIVAAVIIAISVLSSVIIHFTRDRIKKRYASRPKSEITEAMVFSKKLFTLSIVMAIIGPIPLSFIIGRIESGNARTTISILTIALVVTSVISAMYWWTVSGITKVMISEGFSDHYSDQ